MKRLLLSLAIFTLVGIFSMIGINYVNSTCADIHDLLEECEKSAKTQNIHQAEESAKKAEKLFEDRERTLAAFVNHSVIDEAGIALAAIVPLADKDTLPEMLSQLAEAKIALQHIKNDQAFSYQNFL